MLRDDEVTAWIALSPATIEMDESQAIDVVLQRGEMSPYHVKLIRGSNANHSPDRRIGFAIRWIPDHVRQMVGEKDSALLVRGTDTARIFEHEIPHRRPK